jgi:uncharacterized membrane protein
MSLQNVSLWLMAGFYALAGVNHFVNPKFYLKIIPPALPFHKFINWVSGLAEVLLGAGLLFTEYRSMAAWGIIALLIAIFPANIYHFMKGLRKKKMVAVLAIRLPFQILFIWWAYSFV